MGLDLGFDLVRTKGLSEYRKRASFLIQYFIDRTESSCNEYEDRITINYQDIQELLNRCNKVLAKKELAPSLLPNYFEQDNYDDWYFQVIEEEIIPFLKDELLPKFNTLKNDEVIEFWYSY